MCVVPVISTEKETKTMLTHPTLNMLNELGFHGMAKGFQDLATQPEASNLDHGEWLAILLEQEATLRQQKRFEARARAAKLRHDAQVEDGKVSRTAQAVGKPGYWAT